MKRTDQHVIETRYRGHRCRYRVTGRPSGDGPVIFFLSGAFQSMKSWARFERHFAGRAAVLAADLPGTGDVDPLPADAGLDLLAGAARHVLDELSLVRCHVVSASYGTPIAYRMAQLFPERVESLILAGTMRRIPEHVRPAVERTLRLLGEGQREAFARTVMDGLLCRRGDVTIARRRLVERVFTAGLVGMTDEEREKYRLNTRRLLEHPPLDLETPPRVRTLVFTGEHDTFTTPDRCRSMAEAIGGAFTTIRDADHLFHLERFDTTAALVDRFVHGLPLGGIEHVGPVVGYRPAAAGWPRPYVAPSAPPLSERPSLAAW